MSLTKWLWVNGKYGSMGTKVSTFAVRCELQIFYNSSRLSRMERWPNGSNRLNCRLLHTIGRAIGGFLGRDCYHVLSCGIISGIRP